MSDAVFEIYDDNGILQISKDIMTLSYYTKGLVTTVSGFTFSASSSFYIDLPASLTSPLIATRALQMVAPLVYINNGSTARYEFNTNLAIGSTVAYYVFDLTSNVVSPSNVGLELYNGSGQLTYSSNVGGANIYAVTSNSVALPTGRLFATCIPIFAGYRYQDNPNDVPGSDGKVNQTMRQYGGSIVYSPSFAAVAGEVDFQSGRSSKAPDINVPFNGMLVIDVTPFGSVPGEQTYATTISPSNQSYEGTGTSYTFSPVTVSFSGSGTPSYNWTYDNITNGSWSVSSGQGTNSATPTVSSVGLNVAAQAIIYCSITVNGYTTTQPSSLYYHNNGGYTVTASPPSQSTGGTNVHSGSFNISVSVSGGTALSYNWRNLSGGGWVITNGTSSTATVSVSGISSGDSNTGSFVCDVTFDAGVVTSNTVTCTVTNTNNQ